MNLREILTKERENDVVDSFLVGVYLMATPFSTTRFNIRNEIGFPQAYTDSTLRQRSESLDHGRTIGQHSITPTTPLLTVRDLSMIGAGMLGLGVGLVTFPVGAAADAAITIGHSIQDYRHNRRFYRYHSEGHLMATNPDLGEEYND